MSANNRGRRRPSRATLGTATGHPGRAGFGERPAKWCPNTAPSQGAPSLAISRPFEIPRSPAYRANDVPSCMFFAAHFHFCFYHSPLNCSPQSCETASLSKRLLYVCIL